MNYAKTCLNAMVYDGNHLLKRAWLMALASYTYTRGHDGAVINDAGDTISFSRWYAFIEAAKLGWEYLWRKP